MEIGGSSSSSESNLGLIFGKKIYFEDVGIEEEVKMESGLGPVSDGGGGGPIKRGRTSGGRVVVVGQEPPRCQVEGCNLDLTDHKTYHSRHKVCLAHMKTPKVIVNGLEQRFCQQCSRFHQLSEFDQRKRSCRRRLAGHNARRRKPKSGTVVAAHYGNHPSSIYENNSNSGGFVRVTRAPTATAKFQPLPWPSNLDNPPPYMDPNNVQDYNCALSLLSNNTSAASRNQTLTHDYYLNTNAGAHLVQPPMGTMVQTQGHMPTGWGYDTNEAHLGLGQIPYSGYSGETGLGQQGGRQYDSSAHHIDWSL